MRITEQMIIEEARKFMEPAGEIRTGAHARSRRIPQQKIVLAETGNSYDAPAISNRRDLAAFCARLNEEEAFEKFSIIAVNAQCRPIAVYSIQGSLSEVSAYPRVVATFALLANAHSIFLTHNHPGGTCAPSAEDISSTQMLKRLLDMVGIRILDHMITTPDGNTYSLAQHGEI